MLGIPGTITPRGLQLPGKLTFEEWESVGRTLQTIAGSALFWVGDWWRHGDSHFGEEAAQAIDDLGYAVRSVQVAAWVCDRFPPIRRLIEVPFNVHQALAGIEDEARRYELLALAAKDQWSVRQAREKAREFKQLPGPEALAVAQDTGRSVDVGDLVLTLFEGTGLLVIRRHDQQSGVTLNISKFSDEAKVLVLDFLNEGSR